MKIAFCEMKSLKKIASLLLSGVIGLSCVSTVHASTVQINVNQYPDIDIALAKGRSNVNLNNFENDIKTALANRGVPREKVNVEKIETSDINIADGFSWRQDVSSYIGSISISNNGRSVMMKGNTTNKGKNAIWTFPAKSGTQNFAFDYNISFGDSFNAGGMLLKVKEEGGYLTGYMLSFNNYSWDGYGSGAIWKFSYKIGDNSSNMTKTIVKGLPLSNSGRLNVEVGSKYISVSGGGLSSPITVDTDNGYGNGFGFFSDHYSHNCSSIGAFSLNNISLSVTSVKTFSEVIRQPKWRNDSIRVVVNVNDFTEDDFDDPTALGEILSRTINEQIHYIGWGNGTNQYQFNEFIQKNNGNGLFLYSSDYYNAKEQTAQYIKNLLNQYASTQYVVVGQPANIEVTPADLANNTQTTQYPQGRWRIAHNYNYFENTMGQASWAEQWQKNLTMVFDKVGKFDVYFENNLIKTVYSHRLPVADFSMVVNGYSVTLNSMSYDLDKESNNRGIAQEEWKWKRTTDTNWTNGKIPSMVANTDYIVQLRVKDHQGAWSNPQTKYLSTKPVVVPPVASFQHSPNPVTIYEDLKIQDNSYDPTGKTITQRIWTVKNSSGQVIYNATTPLTRYGTVGDYEVSLKVANSLGQWSEVFSRPLKVVDDTTAPEVVINPTNSGWTKSVNVSLSFSDVGGSNFHSYRYVISSSVTAPTSGWSGWIASSTGNITINSEGYQYLHVEAKDGKGNLMKRSTGIYHIDKTAPTATHSLNPSSWTKGNVTISVNQADALSGVKGIKLPDGQYVNGTSASYVVGGNGNYTFVLEDVVGNTKNYVVNVSNIDKTAPNVPTINANQSWTNSSIVPVTISGGADISPGSGLGYYQYKLSGATTLGWTNYSGQFNIENEGITTITARGVDNVGNISGETSVIVRIDRTIPNNTGVVINSNDEYTNSINVNLTLRASDSASGVSKMQIRNDNGSWNTEENNETFKAWALNTGDGTRTVRVRFKDLAGNWSPEETDTIKLDTTAPVVGNFVIQGGRPYYNSNTVNIQFTAIDNLSGIKEMYVSNDGASWTKMAYTENFNWNLTAGDGDRTVYIKLLDIAGNMSNPVSRSIVIDKVKPQGTIVINNGDNQTMSRDVKLKLMFSDDRSGVDLVTVIEDGSKYDFPQTPNSPTIIDWRLSQGTGLKTVHMVLVDRAGNVSDPISDSIVVDKIAIEKFTLTDIVNPTIFNKDNRFKPVSWEFAPQPMVSGGNISFAIDLKQPYDPSVVKDTVTYKVEISNGSVYNKVLTGNMNKLSVVDYTQTITIPEDAPKGSKVYIIVTAKRELLVSPFDTQVVYFPGEEATTKAQIGEISGNVHEQVKFNERY